MPTWKDFDGCRKIFHMNDEILRLPNVMAMIGLKRSWIYKAISEGKFPPPLQLSDRAVGWRRSDVENWLSSRTARPN